MQFAPIFLSCIAILFSTITLIKSDKYALTNSDINKSQQELTTLLLNRASECILHNPEITQKDSIIKLLDSIAEKGSDTESGSDDIRVKFVHAQASIEHVLACAMVLGEIDHLVGVIHTPTPATPLCTKVDNLDKELLDESIRYDLEKLLTVRSRAVIVREYLERGGKLYIAYPEGGLERRTPQQQEIYRQELVKYADHLYDVVLSCIEMDPSKVGATYFFKSMDNEIYAFSVKANQANSPQVNSEWGMWLGKIEDKVIAERINEILEYLKANDGPSGMIAKLDI